MNGHLTPRAASPPVTEPKWVVQKFGGTSIGKFATQIAETIVKPSREERRIAVVGSARSSYTKSEGTTNRLLRAAEQTLGSLPGDYIQTVAEIRADHLEAAERDVASPAILSRLKIEIDKECDSLSSLLEAIKLINELTVKSKDQIISYGEKLSCRHLTAVLQDKGVDAYYIDASTVINFEYDKLNQEFYDNVAEALARKIGRRETRVPVITGYFGVISTGLLKDIGRGYTDLCAALVAVGLKAEELQIWKEVDGIYTADPRIVPTARLLEKVPPAEAAELTSWGSEVVHPATMKQVVDREIPIRVKNVLKPHGPGTIVATKRKTKSPRRSISFVDGKFTGEIPYKPASRHRPRKPTAVTSKGSILVLQICPHDWALSGDFYGDVFNEILRKHNIVAQAISTSQVEVSIAVQTSSSALQHSSDLKCNLTDKNMWEAIEEVSQIAEVKLWAGMAMVSLIGANMKDSTSIAGKMFSVLGEAGINIEMISQGASEINISCVIREKDVERAVNELHTALIMYDASE